MVMVYRVLTKPFFINAYLAPDKSMNMIHKKLFYLTCLLSLFSVMNTHAQGVSRNVLFLGDSYTSFNNLPQLTALVASSAGDNLSYDSYTPGGYKLIQHAADATSRSKVMAGGWNYVVLQDQSQTPALENGNFPTGSRDLCQLIKQHNPCAQPLFYMTWGRENGDALNCPTFTPMCTYNGMDSLLSLNYTSQAANLNAEVSPVGAVWKYLRQNHPALDLYEPDGSHPSQAGSYVAACCFYTAIFKKSPLLITYNFVLNPTDAAIIRNAVKTVHFDRLQTWNFKVNPTSDFNYSITQGVNEAIFEFKPSYGGGGPYFNHFAWDFGDGNTATQLTPGYGATMTHSYAANGTYTVTLSVSNCDPSGSQQSVTQHTIGFCGHSPTVFKTFAWHCFPDTFSTQAYSAYQWYTRNEPIPGETNQSIADPNFYSELSVLTTQSGCSEMSPSFFVDRSPGIIMYDVISVGNFVDTNTACTGSSILLVATDLDGSESLQWTRNGVVIPNPMNDTLIVTSPGTYSVSIFHSNCPAIINLAKQFSLAFVDCSALGIPNGSNSITATLYPNPASGIIHITGPEKIYAIEIYDLLGQKIQSESYGGELKISLDLSAYAAGMYSVKINRGERYLPGKIVIQ
jgi:PKD repeat protein